MKELKNLVTDKGKDSVGQFIWILSIRIIGIVMFIAPMFLPLKAYFYEDVQNIAMAGSDIAMACAGLFISSGGKQIGILLNSIGVGINKFIEKFTK